MLGSPFTWPPSPIPISSRTVLLHTHTDSSTVTFFLTFHHIKLLPLCSFPSLKWISSFSQEWFLSSFKIQPQMLPLQRGFPDHSISSQHAYPCLVASYLPNSYAPWGFTLGSVVKNPSVNAGDSSSIPGLRKIPWRRKWQPTPYSCLRTSWTEAPGGLQSIGVAKNQTRLRD